MSLTNFKFNNFGTTTDLIDFFAKITRLNITDSSVNTLTSGLASTNTSVNTLTTNLDSTNTNVSTLTNRINITDSSVNNLTSGINASILYGNIPSGVGWAFSYQTLTILDVSAVCNSDGGANSFSLNYLNDTQSNVRLICNDGGDYGGRLGVVGWVTNFYAPFGISKITKNINDRTQVVNTPDSSQLNQFMYIGGFTDFYGSGGPYNNFGANVTFTNCKTNLRYDYSCDVSTVNGFICIKVFLYNSDSQLNGQDFSVKVTYSGIINKINIPLNFND